jgi:hypothetical protein
MLVEYQLNETKILSLDRSGFKSHLDELYCFEFTVTPRADAYLVIKSEKCGKCVHQSCMGKDLFKPES